MRRTHDSMRPLAFALAVGRGCDWLRRPPRRRPGRIEIRGKQPTKSKRSAPSARAPATAWRSSPARAAVRGRGRRRRRRAVAVALSGRFPFGVGGVAEPEPGPHMDPSVLVVGARAIVALTTLSAVSPALLLGASPSRNGPGFRASPAPLRRVACRRPQSKACGSRCSAEGPVRSRYAAPQSPPHSRSVRPCNAHVRGQPRRAHRHARAAMARGGTGWSTPSSARPR